MRHWRGVAELKQALRKAVGVADDRRVFLANRSAQLMRLAARSLFQRCQRVLVTDLGWPSYQQILAAEIRHHSDAETALVPIRGFILHDRATVEEVVERIAFRYQVENCDGLFLPLVSNDGVRLPIDAICRAIRRTRPPRFIVVDGAQAFCHTPPEAALRRCDIYLAGCHKWLRAGNLPMGMAFCPRCRSENSVERTCQKMLETAELDDPLLVFTRQLEDHTMERFSETVNLASMFSCRAALDDWNRDNRSVRLPFEIRLENAQRVATIALEVGWRPLIPDTELRSGILLLQAKDRHIRAVSPEDMRMQLQTHGIAGTCYRYGMIRLAMPNHPLTESEIAILEESLSTVGDKSTHSAPAVSIRGFDMPLEPAILA
jgi:aspartate aminotransferase-like enzyme